MIKERKEVNGSGDKPLYKIACWDNIFIMPASSMCKQLEIQGYFLIDCGPIEIVTVKDGQLVTSEGRIQGSVYLFYN